MDKQFVKEFSEEVLSLSNEYKKQIKYYKERYDNLWDAFDKIQDSECDLYPIECGYPDCTAIGFEDNRYDVPQVAEIQISGSLEEVCDCEYFDTKDNNWCTEIPKTYSGLCFKHLIEFGKFCNVCEKDFFGFKEKTFFCNNHLCEHLKNECI